jgi:hypothetical protein
LPTRNAPHQLRQTQATGAQKEAGAGILMSDRANIGTKSVRRDEEGHFLLLKKNPSRSIYIPNLSTPNFTT